MKQKVLLTQETYKALSKAAKSKQLTPDELCEILYKEISRSNDEEEVEAVQHIRKGSGLQ